MKAGLRWAGLAALAAVGGPIVAVWMAVMTPVAVVLAAVAAVVVGIVYGALRLIRHDNTHIDRRTFDTWPVCDDTDRNTHQENQR